MSLEASPSVTKVSLNRLTIDSIADLRRWTLHHTEFTKELGRCLQLQRVLPISIPPVPSKKVNLNEGPDTSDVVSAPASVPITRPPSLAAIHVEETNLAREDMVLQFLSFCLLFALEFGYTNDECLFILHVLNDTHHALVTESSTSKGDVRFLQTFSRVFKQSEHSEHPPPASFDSVKLDAILDYLSSDYIQHAKLYLYCFSHTQEVKVKPVTRDVQVSQIHLPPLSTAETEEERNVRLVAESAARANDLLIQKELAEIPKPVMPQESSAPAPKFDPIAFSKLGANSKPADVEAATKKALQETMAHLTSLMNGKLDKVNKELGCHIQYLETRRAVIESGLSRVNPDGMKKSEKAPPAKKK